MPGSVAQQSRALGESWGEMSRAAQSFPVQPVAIPVVKFMLLHQLPAQQELALG